jgi:hypothetical protein
MCRRRRPSPTIEATESWSACSGRRHPRTVGQAATKRHIVSEAERRPCGHIF